MQAGGNLLGKKVINVNYILQDISGRLTNFFNKSTIHTELYGSGSVLFAEAGFLSKSSFLKFVVVKAALTAICHQSPLKSLENAV
jgi:hypothetical protein